MASLCYSTSSIPGSGQVLYYLQTFVSEYGRFLYIIICTCLEKKYVMYMYLYHFLVVQDLFRLRLDGPMSYLEIYITPLK